MQVGALELVDPVVDDLLQLEEGVIMYDAYLQREVLVVPSKMIPIRFLLCFLNASLVQILQ